MGDSLSDAARRIQSGDELCIISRCVFGGYSPRVKTVLDRSIGVSLPFFTLRGGETHHIPRGGARGRLLACFYGEATDAERDTAARRRAVYETYENALKRGDRNVMFIDGGMVFTEALNLTAPADSCTVDGCHPNDLGFACMAKVYGDAIKNMLDLI